MTLTHDPVAVADRLTKNAATVVGYLEGHNATSLHPEAVFVDATSGQSWQGREAIAAMLDWFYHVAFDAHVEDSRLIVGQDAVALEATFVGRHQGEFAGIAPTGRDVRIPLVVLYDLADDQITGARIYFSVASFLAQVGAAG